MIPDQSAPTLELEMLVILGRARVELARRRPGIQRKKRRRPKNKMPPTSLTLDSRTHSRTHAVEDDDQN